MNLPFVDLKETRFRAAKAFAEQFTQFEWQYLCAHTWFLTGIDQALATGDFFPLHVRAEQTLLDDRIRPRWKAARTYATPIPDLKSHNADVTQQSENK